MQLITGRIESQRTNVANVLVEPLESMSIPTHVCVARSLSALCNNTDVILQVMNVGPTPVTLYKGMCLATATPENEILTITQEHPKVSDNADTFANLEQVDLSHLSTSEQQELAQLLIDFHSLFPANGAPLGQTSVVSHSIATTGPPIHQPLRRVPEALKLLWPVKSFVCWTMMSYALVQAHGLLLLLWCENQMAVGDFASTTAGSTQSHTVMLIPCQELIPL